MFVFQIRRDESSDWAIKNPVLHDGEPGYEVDTRKLKIGDGVHPWSALPYTFSDVGSGGSTSDEAILAHINSVAPHPIYDNDNGPSLLLLYENAKV